MSDIDPARLQIRVVQSAVYATNCTILSMGGVAVVIDPGAMVTASVTQLIEDEGWRVLAVALTHGHADHTWDAASCSQRWGAPVLIHPGDRYRLHGPFTVGATPDGPPPHDPDGPLGDAFRDAGLDPRDFQPPEHVLELDTEEAEGVSSRIREAWNSPWQWRHAPGHTEGSTLYLASDQEQRVAATGDVLFRGAVGRTDLVGGDSATMVATLRGLGADLDPETVLIPGHGPASTMATELATNPYLRL